MPWYFNTVQFKTPSSIPDRERTRQKSEVRSINNNLLTDILLTTRKTEMKLIWNVLTAAQYATLETYIDNGSFPVLCDDTGYTCNLTYATFTLNSGYKEGYGGTKENVSVTIKEE